MIQVGDKFTYHWVGHEECYKGRIYQGIAPVASPNGLPANPKCPVAPTYTYGLN